MQVHHRRGFTLLEVIFSLALLTLIVAAIYQVLFSSSDIYQTGTTKSKIEGNARLIIERISQDIQGASLGTVQLIAPQQVPQWSSGIQYQKSSGTPPDGTIDLDDQHRIYLDSDDEPNDNNDADDDGDQLVDEKRIVFEIWLDGGGGAAPTATADWGHNIAEYLEGESPAPGDNQTPPNGLVDEAGLCFQLNGNKVIIRLTVQAWDLGRNRLMEATVETTVVLKSP